MFAGARALVSSPRVLLTDEPSVGLAPVLVSRVIEGDLPADGADGRAELQPGHQDADRAYIIVHGQIAFEGRSPRELTEPELVTQYCLGG